MSWQRLESTTVGVDLYEGQEARIADPLWLLGRQWQLGETTGEDAASPVFVEATFGYAPITRFRPGPPDAGGSVAERDGNGLPLETAVEREGVSDGPAAARLAAEAGLQLWRLLDTAGAPKDLVQAIRREFPLGLPEDDGLDPVGRRQLELLARRSFDAPALRTALSDRGLSTRLPGLTAAASDALARWARWYGELFSEPAAGTHSWNPQRMEYRFQIAAGLKDREVQLDATEYTGGHLDWYTFDLVEGAPDMGARGVVEKHELRVLPTPARFAGQAASRWWQVESADVSFGDLGAAPEDLARVAVGTYGMLFGDDWFLVPCRLPAGVLVRADAVAVVDTFGERTPIRSVAEEDGPGRVWRFFELTGDESADAAKRADRRCPWMLLPPALTGITESPPVEEVVFRRDEVANLAWAAETRIEGAAGRVVDRVARSRQEAVPPSTAPQEAWRYALTTRVPDHQVPLVPVRSTEDGGLYLQRARLAVSVADEVVTRGALGRILEPKTALLVHDDEIPATGVRVTRSWQMTRRADGGYVLWMGRRKGPPRPGRSPGLVFDTVVRPPPSRE